MVKMGSQHFQKNSALKRIKFYETTRNNSSINGGLETKFGADSILDVLQLFTKLGHTFPTRISGLSKIDYYYFFLV